MEEQIKELRGRLDDHIRIYAANGKESKRVADTLEVLVESNKGQDKKIKSMIDWSTEHGQQEKVFQEDLRGRFVVDDTFRKDILNHIKRVEPYLTGVETTEKVAEKTGVILKAIAKAIIYTATFILTVYGAYLLVKNNYLK